eukprot:TRINITY_DN18208_c0_g2_i1.p1 TRINITY_DN18208_c0_g2~~TRINITY_DN18208_c0_g2_i1.p1  ORF type:complete len:1390 (-),score=255.34 TRINITY_DN18208_c0_g2_i1:129-4298(-)
MGGSSSAEEKKKKPCPEPILRKGRWGWRQQRLRISPSGLQTYWPQGQDNKVDQIVKWEQILRIEPLLLVPHTAALVPVGARAVAPPDVVTPQGLLVIYGSGNEMLFCAKSEEERDRWLNGMREAKVYDVMGWPKDKADGVLGWVQAKAQAMPAPELRASVVTTAGNHPATDKSPKTPSKVPPLRIPKVGFAMDAVTTPSGGATPAVQPAQASAEVAAAPKAGAASDGGSPPPPEGKGKGTKGGPPFPTKGKGKGTKGGPPPPGKGKGKKGKGSTEGGKADSGDTNGNGSIAAKKVPPIAYKGPYKGVVEIREVGGAAGEAGNIFTQQPQDSDEDDDDDFDFDNIWKIPTPRTKQQDERKPLPKKEDPGVKLFEPPETHFLGIALHGMDVPAIGVAVSRMDPDYEQFRKQFDRVESFLKTVKDDPVKKVQAFLEKGGNPDELRALERRLVPLAKERRAMPRLQLLVVAKELREQVRKTREGIEVLLQTANDVQASSHLRDVVGVVQKFMAWCIGGGKASGGGAVKKEDSKQAAFAFSVGEQLEKLSTIKPSAKKREGMDGETFGGYSLVHEVAKSLLRWGRVLDPAPMEAQVPKLHEAIKISPDSLRECVENLQKSVRKAELEIQNCKEDYAAAPKVGTPTAALAKATSANSFNTGTPFDAMTAPQDPAMNTGRSDGPQTFRIDDEPESGRPTLMPEDRLADPIPSSAWDPKNVPTSIQVQRIVWWASGTFSHLIPSVNVPAGAPLSARVYTPRDNYTPRGLYTPRGPHTPRATALAGGGTRLSMGQGMIWVLYMHRLPGRKPSWKRCWADIRGGHLVVRKKKGKRFGKESAIPLSGADVIPFGNMRASKLGRWLGLLKYSGFEIVPAGNEDIRSGVLRDPFVIQVEQPAAAEAWETALVQQVEQPGFGRLQLAQGHRWESRWCVADAETKRLECFGGNLDFVFGKPPKLSIDLTSASVESVDMEDLTEIPEHMRISCPFCFTVNELGENDWWSSDGTIHTFAAADPGNRKTWISALELRPGLQVGPPSSRSGAESARSNLWSSRSNPISSRSVPMSGRSNLGGGGNSARSPIVPKLALHSSTFTGMTPGSVQSSARSGGGGGLSGSIISAGAPDEPGSGDEHSTARGMRTVMEVGDSPTDDPWSVERPSFGLSYEAPKAEASFIESDGESDTEEPTFVGQDGSNTLPVVQPPPRASLMVRPSMLGVMQEEAMAQKESVIHEGSESDSDSGESCTTMGSVGGSMISGISDAPSSYRDPGEAEARRQRRLLAQVIDPNEPEQLRNLRQLVASLTNDAEDLHEDLRALDCIARTALRFFDENPKGSALKAFLVFLKQLAGFAVEFKAASRRVREEQNRKMRKMNSVKVTKAPPGRAMNPLQLAAMHASKEVK